MHALHIRLRELNNNAALHKVLGVTCLGGPHAKDLWGPLFPYAIVRPTALAV